MCRICLDLLHKDVSITLNSNNTLFRVHLPFLLSNVLLVYRVTAVHGQSCRGVHLMALFVLPYRSLYLESLLPPLLEHTSYSEAHFHPLTQSRKLLLHTHTSAPFTSSPYARGLNLTLYSSPDCQVTSLRLRVDWWGTLGHTGVRYWTAVPGWAVGIVMWLMFTSMGINERGGRTATVIPRPQPS